MSESRSDVSGTGWNFADVWETVAETLPEGLAQVHGSRRYRWADFDRRADGVANALLEAGLGRQDKVALSLYNSPEYLEVVFGALKVGLVPVNTNYRYGVEELCYVWGNADVVAVVFHGALQESVASARKRLPGIRLWLHVDDGTYQCPSWAIPYEAVVETAPGRMRPPWGRSGDDLLLIYTGGTTGLPKGVMWRQHDLYNASNTSKDPIDPDLDRVRGRVSTADSGVVGLPAAPLMHGTGFVFATTILNEGGTVVTLSGRRFDAEELLDTLDRERVTALSIVGNAFCRPIVDALDAEPRRWNLTDLKVVASAGMAWSPDVKERLLGHVPEVLLVDLLNSSEASGMGRSISAGKGRSVNSGFKLGKNVIVVDENDQQVVPGSGTIGQIAVRGHLPLGYYKDPEKTAATFRRVGGERCSFPGDYARVERDGTITFLGRGSTTINSGGEKIFTEEVEETLTTFPAVRDAVVVGVPHERFGQVVAAVVEAAPGAECSAEQLKAHVRAHLASYKAPHHIMFVDSVPRGSSGKADYRSIQDELTAWLRGPDQGSADTGRKRS